MKVRAALAAGALAALTACAAPPRAVVRPPPPEPTAPVHVPRAEHQAPTPTPTPAGVVHVVRRGQTLYRIARAYGISPADLMEANGITDPRTLAVGQELSVPGATQVLDLDGAAAAAPTPPPATARPPAEPSEEAPAAALAPTSAGKPALAWPLKGVLYGRFGVRGGSRHDGIDIAAPEGSPVRAAADGTVIYVGEQSGYGTVVILRHEGGLVTVYAHNASVAVREGARVERGQVVARVGQTGRTTGPHLHFEVREGSRPRNPLLFLP